MKREEVSTSSLFYFIFAEHRQFMANIVAIIMIVPEMEPVP